MWRFGVLNEIEWFCTILRETHPDFEKIEQKYGVKIEHHLSRGDVITPYRTNLDGCGYVVCRGDNADSAEMLAEKARLEIDKTIERE